MLPRLMFSTFDVTDHGIGMTLEEVEHALTPFRQIDNRLDRKYNGLGVGLSIVNKLIACHGGRLVIKSAVGQGSTVSLVFPKDLVFANPYSEDTEKAPSADQPVEGPAEGEYRSV